MSLTLVTNGTPIRTGERNILEVKQTESDVLVALVHWLDNEHSPFSTHKIFIEGCKGLYHGTYHSSIVDAVDMFNKRP